jgi:hypothetical protein
VRHPIQAQEETYYKRRFIHFTIAAEKAGLRNQQLICNAVVDNEILPDAEVAIALTK